MILSAVLAGTLVAAPARAGDATGAFAPYEDLVEVVAVLTWHLDDDAYRFPAAKDPTGIAVYGLTLTRLDSWQKRYPGRLADVVGFSRAQVLERLSEFGRARDAYAAVGRMDSPLAEKARTAEARVVPFAEAAAMPEDGPDLNVQLANLRAKLDAWGKLVERHAGTPYQTLALVEEERLERITARLVVEHRQMLETGDETAERALRFLIEKHAESKNLPAYVLRLGDLYADMARDYVEAHDRPLDFAQDEFTRRTDRALETYRKVATWDGAREKPEGQARFAAVESWKSATLARYR
ncbi:MAG: hypothetical protein KIT14_18060 [bacterium]|nr:hypothetical protein [bacterium]